MRGGKMEKKEAGEGVWLLLEENNRKFSALKVSR